MSLRELGLSLDPEGGGTSRIERHRNAGHRSRMSEFGLAEELSRAAFRVGRGGRRVVRIVQSETRSARDCGCIITFHRVGPRRRAEKTRLRGENDEKALDQPGLAVVLPETKQLGRAS